MAKCKNCENLGYLFDGDRVGERVWCGNIADSPVLDMERDCEYYVPQTNADRIRSMTDEELAKYLPIASDLICHPTEECIRNTIMNHCGECEKTEACAMKWLKAEGEE